MKKSTYQKPELTIVSFKSERGFACSGGNCNTITSDISTLFGSDEGGVEARSTVSGWDNSGW